MITARTIPGRVLNMDADDNQIRRIKNMVMMGGRYTVRFGTLNYWGRACNILEEWASAVGVGFYVGTEEIILTKN